VNLSTLYSAIKQLPQRRSSWLLLALTALMLELSALYFQHVMKLEPCVMCIYERITVLAILVAGLIGAIAPRYWLIRLLAFTSWGVGAIWGLLLALEHVNYQLHPSPFATCDFYPNFPEWLPLHEYVPWLFNPLGDCANIEWLFLGYTMPQWLIVAFAIYSIVFTVVIVAAIVPKKSGPYDYLDFK